MEQLIQELKNRRLGVLWVLKMVPKAIWDWKPHPFMRSTSELACHLACSPLAILETIKGTIITDIESYQEFEINLSPPNATGLVHLYEKGLHKLINYLENNKEKAKEETIELFYREKPISLYTEIHEEIGHEWFHLGQLFVYLRQNGVEVDMGAYYAYKDPNPHVLPTE